MNPAEAAHLIPCHRPGLPGPEEPRILKAVRVAEKDPALKEELARQRGFDERWADALEQIPLPAALPARLAAARPAPARPFAGRAALRQPVVIAVLVSALVILGWGGWTLWNRYTAFPGEEDVERMVDVNDDLDPHAMEPKGGKVANLDDWLFSKYGFENFYVPPGFGDYQVALARVFQQDGEPVAQIAVEKPSLVLYSFKADDFGVDVGAMDQWRVFEDGDWVAAVQQHALPKEDGTKDIYCFMVAFHGSRGDMEEFLARQKP